MDTANKWKVTTMKLDAMKSAESNPRVITNRNFRGLTNSIKRFGQVEPIVWNEQTGRIISGHQRYRALVDMGITDALVVIVNMSEEEERAANLTLNNPAIEGEFDEPIADLLNQLQESDQTMFKELNMDSLQKALEKELKRNAASLDMPPEPNFKTKCPCCGNEWEVSVEDVSVEASN